MCVCASYSQCVPSEFYTAGEPLHFAREREKKQKDLKTLLSSDRARHFTPSPGLISSRRSSSRRGSIFRCRLHSRWHMCSRADSLLSAHTSQKSRRMACMVSSLMGSGYCSSLTMRRWRKMSGSCAFSEFV